MTLQINDFEQDLKVGFWIVEEGIGRWMGFYVKGKREGSWSYYEDLALRKVVSYVKGLKNGFGYLFSPAGHLTMVFPFEEDRIHGKLRFYTEDGLHLATYVYIYDKLHEVEHYVLHEDSPPKYDTYLPKF